MKFQTYFMKLDEVSDLFYEIDGHTLQYCPESLMTPEIMLEAKSDSNAFQEDINKK